MNINIAIYNIAIPQLTIRNTRNYHIAAALMVKDMASLSLDEVNGAL